jgi:SWI/SNF-related matrix-associated actin-dependent regulator of chromatin subfamily A3
MASPHIYKAELDEADPASAQPTKIKTILKPHQLSAVEKAMRMERDGVIHYDAIPRPSRVARVNLGYSGRLQVKTNVGVFGDLVGYGKTLTALALVASVPTTNIHRDMDNIYSFHGRHVAKFTAICERPETTPMDMFINTTLIVVPRGPVYMQWLRTIQQQTELKVLALDSLHVIRRVCPPIGSSQEVLKAFFESHDVVLIKSTTLATLVDYYDGPYTRNAAIAWDRIIIDEAHDIVSKLPCLDFKFIWLITATYEQLPTCIASSRNYVVYTLRHVVTDNNLPYLLIRGTESFVRNSFVVPHMVEQYYICNLPSHISVVQPFLNPSAQERVNANDIAGAIREMGGTNETEQDIVAIVTRELEKDIRNKQLETTYVESLEIPQEQKQSKLASLQVDITRLQDRLQSLQERVSQLSNKTCSICYESFHSPIILPCTHIFCGSCLIKWMRGSATCPECRATIKSDKLVAIVQQKQDNPIHSSHPIMDKIDTLLHILSQKPHGKFLIFSRVDTTFHSIMHALDVNGITYAEIKGSTGAMMNILEKFKQGNLRVILLNTHHAGSGIDISCATDVVIFHKMASDKVQAIGRAQRVGRQSTLYVHNLCYPHEMT